MLGVTVRWLTASLDRPARSFVEVSSYWTALTGSSVSPAAGENGEFVTLVPPDGDAYLRLQRTDQGGGSHLDVHVDDLEGFARHAEEAGATRERHADGRAVLRSPAGLPWCVTGYRGQTALPSPQPAGDTGHVHFVDQICIDIPEARFEDECAFWRRVTGWELNESEVRPEYRVLTRPRSCPLRVLLQRCGDDAPARAHLDVSSTDRDAVVAHHSAQGGRVTARFAYWTVLTDPAGLAYCVTDRDPHTGRLRM